MGDNSENCQGFADTLDDASDWFFSLSATLGVYSVATGLDPTDIVSVPGAFLSGVAGASLWVGGQLMTGLCALQVDFDLSTPIK